MTKLAISIGTLQTGGAEMFIANLLKKLDYNKFKVLLIVLSPKCDTFLEKEINALPVEVIYMNKKEGFKPYVMFRIYRILKKFSPNILHGNIGGLIYFLLYIYLHKNIKCIHTAHTLANLEFGKAKRFFLKDLYIKKRIIPVAISNEVRKSIVQTYEIDENKIFSITNGIDTSKFSFPRSYQFEKIIIGHVGRFEDVKNHKVIVEVFQILNEQYNNIGLKLIGDGSLYSEIKDSLSKYDNVEMIRVSQKVNEELRNIDIFFFPSKYEGMPLSLIEAMASGAVVIASKVGGIADIIVNDVNGYLVEDCNDIDGFVNVFKNLINNKDNMIKISKNNIEKAKSFDLLTMVKKYQDLYELEAFKC